MKAKDHPTVKRASIWWAAQVIGAAGLAIVFIFFAIQDPTKQTLIWAAATAIFAILYGLLAAREIKKLRHEYRYEDDADGTADQSSQEP